MTSMIGALSMVVDAGVYFVIKAQLQNAADAAALAAVWYDPSCDSSSTAWGPAGCQPVPAVVAPTCPPPSDAQDKGPCTAATNEVNANRGVALSLCAGPNLATGAIPVKVDVYPSTTTVSTPPIRPYVVTLSCDAPHWFAHILPNVLPTMHINANAAAVLGWLQPNGGVIGGPRPITNPPLAARLVPAT
jgi:Flp pilus assembly protein TadG